MRIRLVLAACLAAAVAALVALPPPASAATTDPFRAKQWGLDRIKAEQAWALGANGTGALVAVVDTGVDLTHPDLQSNLVVFNDADFVEPNGTCTGKKGSRTCVQDGPGDKNGHGSHVAGTVAAVTNNGTGVAAAAPGAKVLPVRVLDAEGSGTTDQVAAGIRYAADKGAEVINLSLGFPSGLDKVVKVIGALAPVYSAIDYADGKGALVVIAAGNDTFSLCAEPSAHPKAVCVGATDSNDVRSYYSNSDATLSSTYLVAPGGDGITCSGGIWSTVLRTASRFCTTGGAVGYDSYAGTSMAAPHVSAVAALLAGKGLTNDQIKQRLISTTDDLGVPGRDSVYGYGRVNALQAVTG